MEVIQTHENSDFDAIASLLGASKLFPRARPALPRHVNRNCRGFLALYGAALPMIQADDLPRTMIHHVILVDTQSMVTLRELTPDVHVDIIDHHERDPDLPDGWHYAGELLGATTTILVEAISARAMQLTSIEATLLLLGIYEDTGSLLYNSTTPRDVRAAAWLLEQGARLDVANEFLHHPLAPGQRELYEQLLSNSETHDVEGHTVIVAAAQALDYEEEISTLAHKLRELLEPSALFVLVALDGRVQLVARSTTEDIDVSVVARRFGGGGHRRAAAALIRDTSLAEAKQDLLETLPQVVRPSVTVAQVMSRGVQVLSPGDTIAEAADRMRRTGHEGYPVVAEARVIGLLTRRAVDRALQFRMGNAPVTQVMEVGSVAVDAHDSIRQLQQLMIETGWGQIPVLDDTGAIVGVVTRTDLITRWGTPPLVARRPDVAALLEQALSAPVLALVRRISQTAPQMGFVPYFVGGLVRDLLLGADVVDIDLVIEGDAIALARKMAREMGGRVRTHRQFGTAKWLLSQRVWRQITDRPAPEDLTGSIDFVTARTEFYAQPTALPEVASSSIKQDLHRRDFTINTLAIRLDPDHWGELLDFYGGEADLQSGVIRVLHSLSFVDDPTRMLRAARFESRLGFEIDPRTRQLISDALPLLKRVSGSRIRHELALIFEEAAPERALCRLDELGVLAQISPGLRCDGWLRAKIHALHEELDSSLWGLEREDTFFLHMALLTYRLELDTFGALLAYLQLKRDDLDDLRLMRGMGPILQQVREASAPSAVARLLEPYPARVLAAGWVIAADPRVRERLLRYQTEWRLVEPVTTGDDLKRLGLKPGPVFGRLLDTLRDARLDGTVTSHAEEQALLERLLAAQGTGATPREGREEAGG